MSRFFNRGACRFLIVWLCIASCAGAPDLRAGEATAKIHVLLWFDTEDYLLPASDDAALRLADFLSRQKIRATFKVVGEKARTLERRQRNDVIAALKKHEIGYHSNYHSVQPTPALYLSNLGWDDGVAEFDRRERPGFEDVKRIFGTAPTCYGQPGSSWGPQSLGAMKRWGMQVYLDSGRHVRLDDRPFYYCDLLNFYRLEHTLRVNLNDTSALKEAEDRFLAARQKLLTDKGGVVSIYYHPCEFVHKRFWDGVNFRGGANPPRARWQEPPAKTAEESKIAYDVFERYIQFIQRFPEVRFVTATEAARLYRDQARGRSFAPADLKAVAAAVGANVTFQKRDDHALSASEVFFLLNETVARNGPAQVVLKQTPLGPASPVAGMTKPVSTDASQLLRTAKDVADYLDKEGRIPPAVWLGSQAVPPEAYLQALAKVALEILDGKPVPATLVVEPANLAAANYVAEDAPDLWNWSIFPPGFRAPALMELARRQAWTLKPALLERKDAG